MAAQENTAINNLLQLVAARRASYEADPAFEEDDEEHAQTHLVERAAWSPADLRSTAERMSDVVSLRRPDGTPNRVQMKKPPRALPLPAPIPSPPGSYLPPHGYVPRHAMEAPALSAAVAVAALPPQPGASAVATYVIRNRPPLAIELRTAFRKLAAPIAFVALFAISLSTYLAFAGNRGEVAAPVMPAPAPAPPIVTSAPEQPSPAAIAPASDDEERAAERSAYASADRTGEEAAPVVDDESSDEEIEMAAVDVERPRAKKRTAAKAPKVARVEKAPEKTADKTIEKAIDKKIDKKLEKKIEKKIEKKKPIEEGELPQNIANKTSSETGSILVTSNVPALIYLDGRNTRMMTPRQFSVPAGAHKITLLEPDTRKARTQDVKVLPGKTVAVEKQF
ncbi:MAG: hypothetical protein KF773_24625 [Deltaproteobacteria bacterium]|nr:hypothetical protein [Deltaproteobacteria bacterium]